MLGNVEREEQWMTKLLPASRYEMLKLPLFKLKSEELSHSWDVTATLKPSPISTNVIHNRIFPTSQIAKAP